MLTPARKTQLDAPFVAIDAELRRFADEIGADLSRGKTDKAGYRQLSVLPHINGVHRQLFLQNVFTTFKEREIAPSWPFTVTAVATWDDEGAGTRFSLWRRFGRMERLPSGQELRDSLKRWWGSVEDLTPEELVRGGDRSPIW